MPTEKISSRYFNISKNPSPKSWILTVGSKGGPFGRETHSSQYCGHGARLLQ